MKTPDDRQLRNAEGSVPAPEPPATEAAVVIDPDWSAREGYDAGFLETEIPLPGLSAAMREISVEVEPAFRRADDPHRLDYHHYSVVVNADRCFAWFSAANVDGDRRFDLERGTDKWFLDPRIDAEFQCGEELYAAADTDRGHLTRYLDVAWGDDEAEAVRSTHDSFHFTNACLQLAGFNRSRSRWQGIERFLLEHKALAELRRISVFTGPLFEDSDPLYQNEFMDYVLPIPLEFWKVCALVRADGTLAATGFVLDQRDVAELPGFEEAFDVALTQVTLEDLERRTGLDFGALKQHDHFAAGGAPGTLEVGRPGARHPRRPLPSLGEIVV